MKIISSLIVCRWRLANFARHKRIKICKNEFETSPSKGFCASQNSWFYEYKLHGVCSVNGIFHSLDITKAEVHDVHFLKTIKQQMSDCMLLVDRDYLSQSIQLDLFQTVNIKLETPKERIKKIISHNLMFLGNQEKELKHYFHNYATSLELETIMPKLLKILKQEF